MKKIVLIGAGGHAKSCIDVIESEKKFKVVGFVNSKIVNIFNYKTIGGDQDLKKILNTTTKYAHIAVGQIKNKNLRELLHAELKQIGFKLPVIISPTSYVSKHTEIKEGSIIMHNVVVNASAKIGKNCIINTNSLVEHDSIIKDNSHIATNAVINGNCIIGKNCFVGSGSIIKENTVIKDNSFIKANSLIYKNN